MAVETRREPLPRRAVTDHDESCDFFHSRISAAKCTETVRKIATGSKGCYPQIMANVEKLSIALTPEMAADLRAAVEDGDYGSVSEVVRDALRDWRMRRKIEALEVEELRRLVRAGIDSGPGLDAGPVFARLRSRFAQPPAE